MPIKSNEVAPHGIKRTMSQVSEYDDALEVPDSLEITVDENGETIQVRKQEREYTDNREIPGVIPFTVIHDNLIQFKSHIRNVFIPGEEVHVKIIDNERSVTTHPLNPNLYTIEFRHGPFIWTIRKRYKHIQYLHNQLKMYRASLKIPFPTKSHRERRNSMKNLGTMNERKGKRNVLPRFPNKPDILVPYEQLNQRRKELEDYLSNLLNIEIYRRHSETINFLDISHLTFVADLGMKGKEGTILKRTGSSAKTRCNFLGLYDCGFCIKCNYLRTSVCGKWQKRHLVVKDTFVAYLNPQDGRIKSVILMDNGFGVSLGVYTTGSRSGLQIANLSRHIVIKCWTKRKAKEWMEFIQEVSNKEGKDFIQTNPHNSFAPYRPFVSATWFVDGADYMSAVADALEDAKEEIFIADWWLSPEIHMKRPMTDGDYWRLDKILQRKAKQGVKIFVLIYKEIEVALGINSYYSKQKLVELCSENIKVLRHPDHARAGVLLWAHHEKIVVIDQSLAFLGGIDLCYGRWDTKEHRLTDLESIHQSSIYVPSRDKLTNTSSKKVLGCTERHVLLTLAIATNTIAMATTRSMPLLPMMDEKTQQDLVLSTLSVDNSLFMLQEKGDGVKCNTPELQRKNLFDVAKTTVDKMKTTMRMKSHDFINMVYTSYEADTDESTENQLSPDSRDYGCNLEPTTKLWLGKDYTNFIVKDFNDLEKPYQDLVDRTNTPRMPWHDIGVLVQNAAARDVARHFIQRWNATKLEKANQNPCYPYLLPKSYKNCKSYASFIKEANRHNVKCQVLRSVSSWSAGFLDSETVERSIQEAYIQAISEAERYIYIENQFFITLASMEKGAVKNQIGETLLKRILRAHREGAVFRVFVVMPLLPGFEGEVGGPSGRPLQAITHWNYNSISRGKDAILNRLLEAGIEDPSEYITFHGLRTHSMLNGTLVTELIYVHSKLMIIDDNTVICGSANINDRSMVATRDSEIAVIIHDQEFEDGRMNNIPFLCGKFASSLRKQLFREHLGLLNTKENINIDDAIIRSFYKDIWCARSKRNTETYEEVFHCIPTDKVVNFAILKQYQEKVPLSISDSLLAQEMIKSIKGHLVDLPLNFLCNEDLKPAPRTVEGIMPTALWT
ncbi:phospholipase D2 isoform X1 [Monomorium pharaonis]|uniref:phospholipase D2 isoform X1 n=2 Tax=Monomorium pharaonis TaxID=307658 RepID=UPI00063F7F83|nr:phospholipase D2 isoform X1 [Monomorium pharaonis]XP_036138452.1 phospholipase D2 isoform X1 [Monomorium pharaonis]